MNLNLITLNTKGRLDFEEILDFQNYEDDRIISLENVKVAGFILDNGTDDYELKFNLTGTINLKSAINNSKVPYELNIEYDEFVNNLVENYKKSANTLDILPIIWENILLEIPIRATNKDDTFESTSGDGWEILETE